MDESNNNQKWKERSFVAILVLIFTLVSTFGINPYRYGISDQSVTVPMVKSYASPDLYPGDYMVEQKDYYYTFLFKGISLFAGEGHRNLPMLFFLGYFICLYLTFLGVYLLALALFERREVGLLALLFAVFAKEALADAATIHILFISRVAVLPVLLFSLHAFIREKYLLAYFLAGLGFLVHPMTSVYVIFMLLVASGFSLQYIGRQTVLKGIGVLLLTCSPILIWKLMYSPESMGLFSADPEWVNLLKLRSPHHIFPLSWGKETFFAAGLVLLVFWVTWKHRPEGQKHRSIRLFTLAILALGAAGVVFAHVLPIAIVLNLQVLRSFLFILFFAMVYYAHYYVVEVRSAGSLYEVIAVAFLGLGVFYEATGLWMYAFAAFLGMTALLYLYRERKGEDLLGQMRFALAPVIIAVVLGGFAFLRVGGFSLQNVQESNWREVQTWARQNTQAADVFIVPPGQEGFRIESERGIYGDWKDGTLLNFNPAFGQEWMHRMKMLGYKSGQHPDKGFRELDENQARKVAAEIRQPGYKVFLVAFHDRDSLDFPLVHQNKRFSVYDLGF